MTPEARSANPNPSVDEYRSEIDLHKRKFAVDAAIRAAAAGLQVDIIALAEKIYEILNKE